MAAAEHSGVGSSDVHAGQYLTFELAGEVYGIGILKVQEIIGIMQVTKVPRMPSFIRGVINLRGKVIPVIDLRLKFGIESIADTEKTCVIVVQVGESGHRVTMGVIVDSVSEVLSVKPEQLEPPPSFGSVDTSFLLGMGKIGNKVVMLLDVEKVLSREELNAAQSAAPQEA